MVNEKMINRLVDQLINWFDNELIKKIYSQDEESVKRLQPRLYLDPRTRPGDLTGS